MPSLASPKTLEATETMDNGGLAHVTWKLKERWQLKTRELGNMALHGLHILVHNMQW